ncbi:MAG: VENN motif pre-toxin domain-containing protein [Candidatus Paracaedibacteraceae bacterium]|nr:VENN motif pre-toxin domain-containing protein [Candidatus Paracaedibacteraceae bacterium]
MIASNLYQFYFGVDKEVLQAMGGGAVGAFVSETIAEGKGLADLENGTLDRNNFRKQTASLSRLSSLAGQLAAELCGLDSSAALRSGENAVENNAIQILAILAAGGSAAGGTTAATGTAAAGSTLAYYGSAILAGLGLSYLADKLSDDSLDTPSEGSEVLSDSPETEASSGSSISVGGSSGGPQLPEDPEKDRKEYSGKTQRLLGRTDDYKHQLFERAGKTKQDTTLNAARKEMKGEPIDLAKQLGVTYDHLTKVDNAQKGLRNHIHNINKRLEYNELPMAERQALQKELSKASKLLDHTRRFVPGN